MTQPIRPSTPTSIHTRPLVASVLGLVAGILVMVQAYFGSGHIPTGAEIAGLISGSGLSLGSVLGFIAAHVGVTKAQIANPTPVPVPSAPVTLPAPVAAPADPAAMTGQAS